MRASQIPIDGGAKERVPGRTAFFPDCGWVSAFSWGIAPRGSRNRTIGGMPLCLQRLGTRSVAYEREKYDA